MNLPIQPPYPPMEAQLVEKIPEGAGWQYEPKWDGFRCIAFRDNDEIQLQSKAGQPLARYFPEVVANLEAVPAKRFVLDAEIVIPVGDEFSFDDLLQRVHPAESRIRKLAAEFPALLIVFDLLVDSDGESLVNLPLRERGPRLQRFAEEHLVRRQGIQLANSTQETAVAREWLSTAGAMLDGIIAKRLDCEYRSGDRTGMQKVKNIRTADCVVGGFRYASSGGVVGSLLLGLYDDDGLLHHVGFTSGLKGHEKRDLTARVEALIQEPGFTGKAPGGPSRWSTERSAAWKPLAPELVVEISYDHFTGGRFRHGTSILRWRPDKAPRQCTMDQVVKSRSKTGSAAA